MASSSSDWPELSYASWQGTCTTLRLWSQIVGKLRLAETPWLNHSWHVTLYVTPRGLTTSTIHDGARSFENHATKPPIIEGYLPPEGWGYCYVDDTMIERDHATPHNGKIPRYA